MSRKFQGSPPLLVAGKQTGFGAIVVPRERTEFSHKLARGFGAVWCVDRHQVELLGLQVVDYWTSERVAGHSDRDIPELTWSRRILERQNRSIWYSKCGRKENLYIYS